MKLEQEYNYYIANRDEFLKEYYRKFLVIKGEKVIAVYDNFHNAYTEITKKEQLGTFMIHQCLKPEEDIFANYANNNVSFEGVRLNG